MTSINNITTCLYNLETMRHCHYISQPHIGKFITYLLLDWMLCQISFDVQCVLTWCNGTRILTTSLHRLIPWLLSGLHLPKYMVYAANRYIHCAVNGNSVELHRLSTSRLLSSAWVYFWIIISNCCAYTVPDLITWTVKCAIFEKLSLHSIQVVF